MSPSLWMVKQAIVSRCRPSRRFNFREAGFGEAAMAAGFPFILEDDGEDTAGEGDGDR